MEAPRRNRSVHQRYNGLSQLEMFKIEEIDRALDEIAVFLGHELPDDVRALWIQNQQQLVAMRAGILDKPVDMPIRNEKRNILIDDWSESSCWTMLRFEKRHLTILRLALRIPAVLELGGHNGRIHGETGLP